jgi:hypothetical protein
MTSSCLRVFYLGRGGRQVPVSADRVEILIEPSLGDLPVEDGPDVTWMYPNVYFEDTDHHSEPCFPPGAIPSRGSFSASKELVCKSSVYPFSLQDESLSSILWAPCMSLTRMAFSPVISCQLSMGSCDSMRVDTRSCLSSVITMRFILFVYPR